MPQLLPAKVATKLILVAELTSFIGTALQAVPKAEEHLSSQVSPVNVVRAHFGVTVGVGVGGGATLGPNDGTWLGLSDGMVLGNCDGT